MSKSNDNVYDILKEVSCGNSVFFLMDLMMKYSDKYVSNVKCKFHIMQFN